MSMATVGAHWVEFQNGQNVATAFEKWQVVNLWNINFGPSLFDINIVYNTLSHHWILWNLTKSRWAFKLWFEEGSWMLSYFLTVEALSVNKKQNKTKSS